MFEEVTGGFDSIELGTASVQSRAYVSWFGFKGGDQQKLVANLSGGKTHDLIWQPNMQLNMAA